MIEGFRPPCVHFRTRVRDESIEGPNPYRWETVTSDSIFKNRRVVLFSLPGAFTPTCSTYQLPGFEENYDNIRNADIDEVYCISVNDSFVMNKWGDWLDIDNVKLIPDGSAYFTEQMGALVRKDNLGFGPRSWRYSLLANDGVVEVAFVESGCTDDCPTDPYEVSDPLTMMEYVVSESLVGRQHELNLEDGLGTDETFA